MRAFLLSISLPLTVSACTADALMDTTEASCEVAAQMSETALAKKALGEPKESYLQFTQPPETAGDPVLEILADFHEHVADEAWKMKTIPDPMEAAIAFEQVAMPFRMKMLDYCMEVTGPALEAAARA